MSDDETAAASVDCDDPSEELPAEIVEIVEEESGGDEEKKEILLTKISAIWEERFSGPLPPPQTLQGYKDVMPDAPGRIFDMAETQQAHRIKIQTTIVEGNEKRANWGLGLGFVLFFGLAVGSVYLLVIGKDIAGFVTLATSIVAAAGNMYFVSERRHGGKEKEEAKKEE